MVSSIFDCMTYKTKKLFLLNQLWKRKIRFFLFFNGIFISRGDGTCIQTTVSVVHWCENVSQFFTHFYVVSLKIHSQKFFCCKYRTFDIFIQVTYIVHVYIRNFTPYSIVCMRLVHHTLKWRFLFSCGC